MLSTALGLPEDMSHRSVFPLEVQSDRKVKAK